MTSSLKKIQKKAGFDLKSSIQGDNMVLEHYIKSHDFWQAVSFGQCAVSLFEGCKIIDNEDGNYMYI